MQTLSELNMGDQVRAAKNRLGLSLQEVAKKSSLSFDSVTKIASGINTNIRIKNLLRLSEVLEIDVKKILSPLDNKVEFRDLTARGAAYVRSFSDIEFAKQITGIVDGVGAHRKIMPGVDEIGTLIPILKYRYEMINAYIDSHKPKQVFEFAAGYTPRGIRYASNNQMHYIEADFEEIMDKKSKVVKKLLKRKVGRLTLIGGDILNKEFMTRLLSLSSRKKKKTIIVCEGLLAYLNKKEQISLIENIRTILRDTGGVWITTDVPSLQRLKKDLKDDNEARSRSNKLFGSKSDNVLLGKGFFKTEKDFIGLLESLGFKVGTITPSKNILDSVTSILDCDSAVRHNLKRRKLLVASL